MQTNTYGLPALAAIVLAILFPWYWGTAFIGTADFVQQFRQDVTSLSLSDALFVFIGVLEIYLYLSLRRLLAHKLNLETAGLALLLMAVAVGVFQATVLVDVFLALFGAGLAEERINLVLMNTAFVALGVLFVYAVFALMLSVSLLRNGRSVTAVLKGFAGLLIIIALFQITVVLSVFNVILFPVAMLLLAFYFLRSQEMVEVV